MTVQIRHLATSQPDFESAFRKVLHWSAETDSAIEDRVAAILADVRAQRHNAAIALQRLLVAAQLAERHAAAKGGQTVP